MELLIVAIVALAYLLHRRSAAGASLPYQQPQQTTTNGLDNVTEAIARYEGFYIPGSVAQRTNNPGNVGTYGGQVASYADSGDGWTALQDWVTSHAAANPSWNFYDLTSYYLTGSTTGNPGPGQDPNAYAQYIADYLGVSPTTTVSSTLGS